MLFLSIFNVKLPKKSSSLKISGGGDPIFYGPILHRSRIWHFGMADNEPKQKRQRTTTKLTPSHTTTVTVRVGLPSPNSQYASTKAAFIAELLHEADAIEQHTVAMNDQQDTIIVTAPFTLHSGANAATSIPSLLWFFAILSTDFNEEPEVTFDETDASVDYLQILLRTRNSTQSNPNNTALLDTIHAIERMAQESQPLSPKHAKVFISKLPILSKNECQSIVQDAETFASKSLGGWGTRRHVAYPTTDLSVKKVPALAWLKTKIEQELFPEFEQLFRLKRKSLFIEDMFVAKYEYEDEYEDGEDCEDGDGKNKEKKQAGLGEHEDGSPWSFVLPLNECCEFDGGGTQFVHLEEHQQLHRPPQGMCVMFSGKNRHKGLPITRGVRYILAGFLGDDSDFVPPDVDVDDVSSLEEEEEITGREHGKEDAAQELRKLAKGATMNMEDLLPPGYLEAREK
jgi:hypothetical protein